MTKKTITITVSAVLIAAVIIVFSVLFYSRFYNRNSDSPDAVNQTLEKYYDYFNNNNWQITSILAFTDNTFDFSDDALATFAVMGLPNYNWETGHTREEFDAVTDKYFGRSAVDYRTSMTEIIPETERIRAVGWSFDSTVHMVLRDLNDIATDPLPHISTLSRSAILFSSTSIPNSPKSRSKPTFFRVILTCTASRNSWNLYFVKRRMKTV